MDARSGRRGSRASRDRIAQWAGIVRSTTVHAVGRPRISRETRANMPKSMDFSCSRGGRGLGRRAYVGDRLPRCWRELVLKGLSDGSRAPTFSLDAVSLKKRRRKTDFCWRRRPISATALRAKTRPRPIVVLTRWQLTRSPRPTN